LSKKTEIQCWAQSFYSNNYISF